MKLYYHPISAYSHKALCAAYEKGIEPELELVDLLDPAAKAAYAADVNPLGKVPFLVLDDGWKVPESSIIVEYFDQKGSGPRLISEDPDLSRQQRFIDRTADLYLQNPAVAILLQNMRGPEANAEIVEANQKTLDAFLPIVNAQLEGKDYAVGGAFSFADIAATAAIGVLPFGGVDMSKWPEIRRYYGKQMERPSWQKIMAAAKPFHDKLAGG